MTCPRNCLIVPMDNKTRQMAWQTFMLRRPDNSKRCLSGAFCHGIVEVSIHGSVWSMTIYKFSKAQLCEWMTTSLSESGADRSRDTDRQTFFAPLFSHFDSHPPKHGGRRNGTAKAACGALGWICHPFAPLNPSALLRPDFAGVFKRGCAKYDRFPTCPSGHVTNTSPALASPTGWKLVLLSLLRSPGFHF